MDTSKSLRRSTRPWNIVLAIALALSCVYTVTRAEGPHLAAAPVQTPHGIFEGYVMSANGVISAPATLKTDSSGALYVLDKEQYSAANRVYKWVKVVTN